MEQKQLDEIDESYFGEEFVDEEPIKETKKVASTKSTKTKKTKKATTKKITKSEKKVEEKKNDEKEDISITPVKKEIKVEEVKTSEMESSSPIDPWASEESNDSGFGVGTWKAITGILLILLIFSIYTSGFNFAEGTGDGKQLLLSEAESKALDFVNANLLQPPFVAEIESSAEENGLYKVSLSVAGQSVDSYITKDGSLFFPQGFEINVDGTKVEVTEESIAKLEQPVEEVEEVEPVEVSEEEDTEEVELVEVSEEEDTEEVEPVEVLEEETIDEEVTLTGVVNTVPLVAKKWSFSPDTVTVKEGDIVKLNIAPDTSKAAFALNEFTFAVVGLGVEEEVSGVTVVEFTASEVGSFDFTCSSCEDWRGMSGTLIVE